MRSASEVRIVKALRSTCTRKGDNRPLFHYGRERNQVRCNQSAVFLFHQCINSFMGSILAHNFNCFQILNHKTLLEQGSDFRFIGKTDQGRVKSFILTTSSPNGQSTICLRISLNPFHQPFSPLAHRSITNLHKSTVDKIRLSCIKICPSLFF